MAVISLFGQEAQEIIKPISVYTPKEEKVAKSRATDMSKPKKTREPKKPKEQSISDLRYEQEKSIKRLRELEAQDESNMNEGLKFCAGKEANMPLVKNHIYGYQKQIEKLQEPFNPMLNKWKEFIVNYCVANNQEIDKIWFDVSTPMDCEIELRLKGHRCWNACVSFRFENGRLRAYDSHFGGGTSFIDVSNALNPNGEQEKVEEILQRVFKKECSDSSWEDKGDREIPHRTIIIGENGWRSEIDINDYMSENEKEDRQNMLIEVNEKGFIEDLNNNFIYWTHYGKKQNNFEDFEALLNDSFYGLIVKNKSQEVTCGENQNTQTNTWIITKDFFEYLKPKFKKVEGQAKWTK